MRTSVLPAPADFIGEPVHWDSTGRLLRPGDRVRRVSARHEELGTVLSLEWRSDRRMPRCRVRWDGNADLRPYVTNLYPSRLIAVEEAAHAA